MESDTFYEDFVIKIIWRLSGNFIYHVSSMKTPNNLQTNFTTRSPLKVSLPTYTVSIQSPH